MTGCHWMSIEVFDGGRPASAWAEQWGDRLIESALSNGVVDWTWHTTSWGVIFEIAFPDSEAWDRFRSGPALLAAIDAVPDPDTGVIVYRGRGGSAGLPQPRCPRPLAGAGAAALPLPVEEEWAGLRDPGRSRALLLSG